MGNVKVRTKQKIDPEEWYGLVNIFSLGLFPWCKTIKSVRGWIERDKASRDILKVTITGTGRETRYLIKGKNLIKFIASIEAGDYM